MKIREDKGRKKKREREERKKNGTSAFWSRDG